MREREKLEKDPLDSEMTRRRFIRITSALAGLAVGSAYIAPALKRNFFPSYNHNITWDELPEMIESHSPDFLEPEEKGSSSPIIQGMFESMDGVDIIYNKHQDESYIVQVMPIEQETVPRGEFQNQTIEEISTNPIRVLVNPKTFQLKDIKGFTKDIEIAHNSFIKSLNLKPEDEQDFLINPSKTIAIRWNAFIDTLEELHQENNPEFNQELKSAIPQVIETLKSVMPTQDIKEKDDSKKEDPLFKNIIKEELIKLLTKERDPKKFQRLEQNLIRLVRRKAKEEMKNEFLTPIFERGMAEAVRQSDLLEEFKQAYNKGDLISSLKFDWEKDKEAFNEALQQNDLDTASKIQLQIAKKLNNILFFQDIWQGDMYKGEFTDIKNREVNCVARGAILYKVWKEVFDQELYGAKTNKHFFTVLPLADKRLVALGYEDTKFMNKWLLEDNHNNPITLNNDFFPKGSLVGIDDWIYINDFQRMMTASIFIIKGADYTEKKNKKAALFYDMYALRFNPKNPNYMLNYAKGLQEKEQPKRAESYYLMSLKYDNKDPNKWFLLGELYRTKLNNNNDAFSKALYCYQQTLSLTKNGQISNIINVNFIKELVKKIEQFGIQPKEIKIKPVK